MFFKKTVRSRLDQNVYGHHFIDLRNSMFVHSVLFCRMDLTCFMIFVRLISIYKPNKTKINEFYLNFRSQNAGRFIGVDF